MQRDGDTLSIIYVDTPTVRRVQKGSAAGSGAQELSLTNEQSRSGSSAQPTALYNEATTLGTQTLYPALPKSTSLPRTLIT
ncbi:hypothetical protein FHG87_017708 [Trinorchestia longiramus]|nr:hypothetical protein FHG87_017708 [Trinorchestia longiramus]